MSERIISSLSGKIYHESDIRVLQFLGRGTSGRAFKLDEERVIKILNNSIPHRIKTLVTIKDLQLPNFYKLYDILYEGDLMLERYVGCISSYHKSEPVNIFEMPSSWIIDNFESLSESVIILGRNKIKINDLIPGNVIINRDGITVIDVDGYEKQDRTCVRINLDKLKTIFFFRLLKNNYNAYYSASEDFVPIGLILNDFFSEDTNIRKKDFVKILSKYPRFIDYVRERTEKQKNKYRGLL